MTQTPTLMAHRLRHRVDIQELIVLQDSETGDATEEWSSILAGSSSEDEPTVAAEIIPMSGREFVAASATQASVDTRIAIRWRSDVVPSMRVVHGSVIYNIRAVLPDPSMRRWLTLMCQSGVNDG